jgi:hypothetical protein
VVLALVTLVGIAAAGWQVSIQVLLQSGVADQYRGRIFGAYGTLNALVGLIGMGLASALGDRLGAVPLLDAAGALNLVAAALALALLRTTPDAPRAATAEAVGAIADRTL